MAVNGVVGGVKVEDQMVRSFEMGSDELLDQRNGHAYQGGSVDPVFEPAERRRRSELRGVVRNFADSELEGRISPQSLMVVEILVSGGDSDDALGEHGFLIVDDQGKPARVGDGSIECVKEAKLLAHFSKQEDAGVRGEPATVKIGDDRVRAESGKWE